MIDKIIKMPNQARSQVRLLGGAKIEIGGADPGAHHYLSGAPP